jgi:hypothetical protein
VRSTPKPALRLEAPGDLDLPYCQIGSTGIVIQARDIVAAALRSCSRFPRGSTRGVRSRTGLEGRVPRARQVFNLNTLVDELPSVIDIEKWFIGNGGVTGKGDGRVRPPSDMSAQSFALRALRLAFRQNALIEGLDASSGEAALLRRQVVLSGPGDHQRADARLPGFGSASWGRSPASNPTALMIRRDRTS